MTFEEYVAESESRFLDPTLYERRGQAYFNVLWQERPDLSEFVRGTELDPFYHNERLPNFLDWIMNNW